MSEQLTETVAFRITADERARLEAMAQETGRRPSNIMRRLLSMTESTGLPDLHLRTLPDFTQAFTDNPAHLGKE